MSLKHIAMDMDNYAQQALDMHHKVPNAPPLRANVHCPWCEPSLYEIEHVADEGSKTVFGHCAASLLMKLLYAARMVRLDICYSINSLSRYVTRWNSVCDKQLSHLFSYLQQTKSSKLNATIDTLETEAVELHAYPDADLAGSCDSTRATSGGFIHLSGLNTFSS